jgi:hypothetical protein
MDVTYPPPANPSETDDPESADAELKDRTLPLAQNSGRFSPPLSRRAKGPLHTSAASGGVLCKGGRCR